MIRVYERPGCIQCVQVKKYLSERNVAYESGSITETNVEVFKELGITQAPIVAYRDGGQIVLFGGHDPKSLDKAIAANQ